MTIVSPFLYARLRNLEQFSETPEEVFRGGFFTSVFVWAPIFMLVISIALETDLATRLDIPRSLAAAFGGGFGALLASAVERHELLRRAPGIGRSVNAYLLARAKKEVEDAKKRVRRYEEFDLPTAEAA
ncbi:MAG: hypothetical protein R3C60_09415 [Parvularculaceae bacterium]